MHQFDEPPALALLHTIVDTFTFNLEDEGKKLLTLIAAALSAALLKLITTLSQKDLLELGIKYEEEYFQVHEARQLNAVVRQPCTLI
jgi:hypothetical protein